MPILPRLHMHGESGHDLVMQLKRKPTALLIAGGMVLWEIVLQPLWNLNLERLAERQKIDTTLAEGGRVMDALAALADYLPDSFALGFAAGAVIFAYWDTFAAKLPFIRRAAPEPEAPPPVIADPREPLLVWAGSIDVTTHEVAETGSILIHMTVCNVGAHPARLFGVTGHIILETINHQGHKRKTPLPKPAFDRDYDADPLPYGFTRSFVLRQHVPPSLARELLATENYERGAYLDFRNFTVEFNSAEDRDLIAKVDMWEGVRLSRSRTSSTRIHFLDDAKAATR